MINFYSVFIVHYFREAVVTDMKKNVVGGIVYFLLSAFFISTSFASFKDGAYHVSPSDPVHQTINSVLNLETIKNPPPLSGSSAARDPVKIYVHNEGHPYKEIIELNMGMVEVELIGVPDNFGNKPIIDGSVDVGDPEANVINVVYKEKNAGSIHGFIIQGGITGVKITASDLKLYNNDIRNNKYGISISFGYGPEPDAPDLDGDGVKDEVDSCPGTPTGGMVNRNGCSSEQIALLGGDSDNDGVPDGDDVTGWIDRCPGTTQMPEDTPPLLDPNEAYVPVNVDGCPYGDIFGNKIHRNSEWNINVFTNREIIESSFVTQPLIRNNDIYDSKLGIAVRSNTTPGSAGKGMLNLRPIIYANKIYDIKGKGGTTGLIMGAINVVNNGYAKIIGNDIGDSLLKVSRGISFGGGSGVVFSNDIHHTALSGGAGEGGVNISADSFDVLVMNNRIYSNASNGVSFTSKNGIKIINNTIDSNVGHGVIQDASGGIVKNNIFSFNNGYGYELNVAYVGNASYNGFWKNKLGSYGGGGDTGTGDLEAEPLYVNGTPNVWNYHLLSSSSFVDAGDPADDCFNEPPTPGNPACRVDMGAYGNTKEATIPGDSTSDSDGDGTYDTDDRCPNTPTPTPVMAGYGCSEVQANGDDDADSVKNINDECRNTPSGVEVDLRGCPPAGATDSDNDGIMDPSDRCPNTSVGERGIVDSYGCGPSQQKDDTDGDKVLDPDDECPNTPSGVFVNDVGCPVASQGDMDRDGVEGVADRCQGTALSDLPLPVGGVGTPHGCSPNQLEDDTDGDNVFDYRDDCPNTSSNVPVNVNGCVGFSSDFDGDGVTDDIDACPATPAVDKDNVDTRGCTPPQALGDDDTDDVENADDLCPGTSFNADVDKDGCETPVSDVDKDGVPDYLDRCPATLASDLPLPLNSVFGCAPAQLSDDSDGDGVFDPSDKCPGSLAEVDKDGCFLGLLDDDADKVINSFDRCPGTPSGDVVNAFGCSEVQMPTDTDQDKVRDMLDRCSGTPPGSVVDAVGCINAAKNDADGDGVVDADDRCSDTPKGISVDPSHGCSEEQMVKRDDDGDLVPNYRDQCPGTKDGETVEDSSGCPAAVIADINLRISTSTNGGIELKWDRFQGNDSDFQGYYIYKSKSSEALELIADALQSVLAPSITWQGALILTVLFVVGFFVMGKQRSAGMVFFVVVGIFTTSVYIRANTGVDARNPLAVIENINQTSYIDTDIESGVKYFYRVVVAGKDVEVYPTNVVSHAVFAISGKGTALVGDTSPKPGALDVSLNAPVVVAFDELMNPETLNGSTVLLTKGGNIQVPGRILYNSANMTLTYTPLEPLEPAVTHTFTMLSPSTTTTGVKSLAGDSLPFDYRFTFMTEFASGISAEDRYFPLSWSGTLRDVNGNYMTMNFSMTSTTDISTGPTAGGGVGPGGSVGPGGNSLMTISGTFSDGTEVVGRVEYKCPGDMKTCSVSEALTDEYAIFLSRSSGGTLVINGNMRRVGESWIASGAQWLDDRPVGWNMLFRNWSASPSK